MTDEELRALAEAAKAVPGEPWSSDPMWWESVLVAHDCTYHGYRDDAAYIAAASPGAVLGLLDRATNAEKDFHDAMELVRKYSAERDEAREAVKRLAGALEDITNYHREAPPTSTQMEAVARAALADPVVKRIVEGE